MEVVKELRRLLPGAEPGQVLRSDPSWLLRCGRGCIPAPSARNRLRSCSRAPCTASADSSGCSHAAACLDAAKYVYPLSGTCLLACGCGCVHAHLYLLLHHCFVSSPTSACAAAQGVGSHAPLRWGIRLERGPKKVGALPEDKCY